jgi:hypothetical protein
MFPDLSRFLKEGEYSQAGTYSGNDVTEVTVLSRQYGRGYRTICRGFSRDDLRTLAILAEGSSHPAGNL